MEIKFWMKLRVKQWFYEWIEWNAMYEDDGLISLKNNLTWIIIVNKDFLEAIEEIESN
jgi:hypothetical protein